MVHWYKTPQYNHVYINTSIKGFDYESLINALFGDAYEKVKGEEVFRAFDGVTRLAVMNFGGRKGRVGDVSFQSFYGRGVQDGITLTEQGRLVKNNLFGVGYRFGKKISIGCSISGKIWSYMRGNIKEYIDWCRHIGTLIENDRIDPNLT